MRALNVNRLINNRCCAISFLQNLPYQGYSHAVCITLKTVKDRTAALSQLIAHHKMYLSQYRLGKKSSAKLLVGIRQTVDYSETFSTDILKTSSNRDTGVCDTTRVRILANGRAQVSEVEQRQLQFLETGMLNITLGNTFSVQMQDTQARTEDLQNGDVPQCDKKIVKPFPFRNFLSLISLNSSKQDRVSLFKITTFFK